MSQQTVPPGRPLRLELNAQRVTVAFRFYSELFGWTSKPLHVHPWGSILLIANGPRVFGTQFMAMGAFATPRWLIWFSADLDRAKHRIKQLGGDIGRGIHQLGNGLVLDAHDPKGHSFSLIDLQDAPPDTDQCGDPCLAEFWGPNSSDLSPFYADVLDLKNVATPTGAMLTGDDDAPRLFLRDTPFDIQPPRWIPYFRTSSTGGDCERARRAGAVVQVHCEIVPNIGHLVILSDPAGTYFGLVNPDQT